MHRKTTDPIFDHQFIFDSVPEATLELLLFAYDPFYETRVLGRYVHVLLHLEINVNMRQKYWKSKVRANIFSKM